MGKKHNHHINRRTFLGQAGCAAMGYTTLFSTLTSLQQMNAAAIANSAVFASGDYKALVCISLGGGSDSFNMLMPYEQNAYNTYSETRTNMGIDREDILPLNNGSYGVHPNMTHVRDLYNSNKLSFISNVGTLVEPITKQQFYNDEVQVPLGLYSHSDQMQQWQTAMPLERSQFGWGGRIADLMGDMNSSEHISMNISVGGTNLLHRGEETIQYVIDADGPAGIDGYDPGWALEQWRKRGVDNMVEQSYLDKFKKIYVDNVKVTRDAFNQYSDALEPIPLMDDIFDYNSDYSGYGNYSNARRRFLKSLETVVRSIQARETMGFKRQIFFVDLSGWDMHDELLYPFEALIGILSEGLGAFNTALEMHDLSECVTTFTLTEFARTLTSNGSGTDHAWGGNVMVMGGSVNGGQIFGTYPNLELFGDIELGGGVLIPDIATDQYFAELSSWFGVEPSELATLFPSLGNFSNLGGGPNPIGFLNY